MGADPAGCWLSARGLAERSGNPPAQQPHEGHESAATAIRGAAIRQRMQPRGIRALQVGEAFFHQSLQFQPIAFGKLHGAAGRAFRHLGQPRAIRRRQIRQKPREQGFHIRFPQGEKIKPAATAANGRQKPRGG